MHAAFPLAEPIWLEWLGDEAEAVEGEEDVARVEALFGEAVQDYLSIPLWAQYLECVVGWGRRQGGGGAEGRAAGGRAGVWGGTEFGPAPF